MTLFTIGLELLNGNRVESACERRNTAWVGNRLIPTWVKPETVELDRFFTNRDVAAMCLESLLGFMDSDHAKTDDYCFLEPSVGEGAFYDLLPKEQRYGIDILADRAEVLQQDFLSWNSDPLTRYAVIGNPPFGYRGWLALSFMNHAATFADYIGMILPMSFQSDGKGSPKHRVVGAELKHMMLLPDDSFADEEGTPVKVNALWQIWKRGVNNRPPIKTCQDWVELFTADRNKNRLCGLDRLEEADWLLQRTYFGATPPKLVTDFSEVKYGCGYGIIIKKEKEAITDALNSTDWNSYSNLAAHNCRHISMYHIRDALTDAGFVDG